MGDSEKFFLTARTCGFCRGVRGALEHFDNALALYNAPVYVLHELVHNNSVTNAMTVRGAKFVSSVEDVPDGSVLLIGAHGVPADVKQECKRRFTVIDATCPRVLALQKLAGKVPPQSELVMLGKKGHPEAEGVIGHSATQKVYLISSLEEAEKLPDLNSPVLLAQTTVSGELADAVKSYLAEKYPDITLSSRICDASDRRQQAVKSLAAKCGCIIVVGSKHSSNACELFHLAEKSAKIAFMVDSYLDITEQMLSGCSSVGITAGASTPDNLIEGVKDHLLKCGYRDAGVAE